MNRISANTGNRTAFDNVQICGARLRKILSGVRRPVTLLSMRRKKRQKLDKWHRERMLAPQVAQAAFDMWVNRSLNLKQIAEALQLPVSIVRTMRRRHDWDARYDAQMQLVRENYDANVANMVESRNPLLVHHELDAVALADKLVTMKLKRAIRHQEKLPDDATVDRVTDLTRSLKTTVEARAKLVDPGKRGSSGKGDTFIGRAVIIGSRPQPLRKHVEPPAIEATATEIPVEPPAFF